ncbi:uncharacterized protein LACBIDRAFT_315360 [Laccaria bicolor S238N-H82]|uniref:Carboxylic ester hydrolase n=1 Tax=Laccaria bicolor (strain S238N-H82 / ATCC MYA-4686) TaxID=486041 RepID=B0D279_LACBS|nr:uncharacterized protein LACBIDRAFT_315360 [Laccaria bicolor S238N-H82]EDR10695.1 predicted protein [Laccaria bicolor S238N-H82]|eukprot:XP_001877996.1 predicted protein [Laccaria bicolor S238N-H82]
MARLTRILPLPLLLVFPFQLTAAVTAAQGPIVTLHYGSFKGNLTGNSVKFLGIPFAAPPIGNLRFAPAEAPIPFKGVRQATTFGAACFQQSLGASAQDLWFQAHRPCLGLSINVFKPASIPAGKKLPVIFWIHGGGYQVGGSSSYQADPLVARSVTLGEPVIYVSANYRLNAFGFLQGKEAKAAGLGNIGLRDQRFALQWVQKHISAFGGDPKKVIIWGESAGAFSAGYQIVTNNGDTQGLFRGAFMESGSPAALNDITVNQRYFDQLVVDAGCQGSADPIACLRTVPFDKLGDAINQSPNLFSYQSLALVWGPSKDGLFFKRDPQDSLLKGLYAKVPFVTGDCDDEGTLFSLSNKNITMNEEFLGYMKYNYLSGISDDQLAAIAKAYPEDPAQGSPFGTETANAITPQFKRLSAVQGDLFFQVPRRFFLKIASKTQPTFAFLYKRGKATPTVGALHGSDLAEFYGVGTEPDFIGADALSECFPDPLDRATENPQVNFANTLDPNTKNPQSLLSSIDWPCWGSSAAAPLFTFLDPAPSINITFDNYRVPEMDLLTDISLKLWA